MSFSAICLFILIPLSGAHCFKQHTKITYLNLRFSFGLILGLNLEDPVGLPDNLAALNSILTLVQNSHLITLKRKTEKNYCFMARSHGLVVKADGL
jgi:hypothetical protein